jgi:hypothetical protein
MQFDDPYYSIVLNIRAAKIVLMMMMSNTGITVHKFKITINAQNDIWPKTTTYPVKQAKIPSNIIPDPKIHTV